MAGGAPASGGVPAIGGTTATGGATVTTGGKTAATGGNQTGGTSTAMTGGSGVGGGTGGNTPTTGGASTGGTSSSSGGTSSGGSATGGSTGTGGSRPSCATAATLKEAGNCTGRLIGTALSTKHLQDTSYTSRALEFDYITPEDEMKWDVTEPTRNQFTFGPGDQIADFANANGMKIKGHTLVWYNQLPSWVSSLTSASDLRSAMVNHIQRVMQHYDDKGGVIAWDVVNEAWDDTDPTKLRDSVFSRVIGSSYIDDAFSAAHTADPTVKLFYNDYATDGLSTKSNSVYTMVQGLKSRGIPIDGVGIQMHWRSVGSTLTAADVISNMQRLIALGLEVVISEMDVQLCKGGTLSDQQARFHDIVAACLTQPKCTAVTFWGITDKYSWLNSRTDLGCTGSETPRPLLWDDSYNKKPAYTGVMDALLGR
jgi:endo-1,4-beta-xylanase